MDAEKCHFLYVDNLQLTELIKMSIIFYEHGEQTTASKKKRLQIMVYKWFFSVCIKYFGEMQCNVACK
jgi:hypothetical protein